jgi:hypothetical protein
MRNGHLAGLFENVRLGRVIPRVVGFAAGDVRQGQRRDPLGVGNVGSSLG